MTMQPKGGNGKRSQATGGPQALALLQEIRSGHRAPQSISPAERRSLVSMLMVEGQSTADIAHLLKVCDRTIERDKKAIREENAIAKDPKFVEQMVGRLVREAETCTQRIRKALRERDATVAEKIEGEHRCFQIADALAERLQSLGYLPTAAQKVEAELVGQRNQSTPTLAEIQHESLRLGRIHNRRLASSNEAPESVVEFEEESNTSTEEEGDHVSDDRPA